MTDAIREHCTQHPITTVVVGSADRDAFSSYVAADDVTRIGNAAPVPGAVVQLQIGADRFLHRAETVPVQQVEQATVDVAREARSLVH